MGAYSDLEGFAAFWAATDVGGLVGIFIEAAVSVTLFEVDTKERFRLVNVFRHRGYFVVETLFGMM